jgi:hypothetical protein
MQRAWEAGVFVQTVMIKITQLLENSIRLRTFNKIYAGSKGIMDWVGFLGVRLAFGRCMGKHRANGDFGSTFIHLCGREVPWANSFLHPWGSEIVESGFESCLLMICVVV